MFKFIHMSDTHLGSRMYMSDEREQDFYDAFQEAIDISVREGVDFIVHSGDLFDTWSPSNLALSKFRDSALAIRDAGIPMYLIMGDHDRPKRADYPAAEIFNFLGIRLLGREGLETTIHQKNGEEILIAGISNLKGFRRSQLLEEYRKAENSASGFSNSILISHQAITGFLYDEACEAKPSDLPANYSYLAFGHVHDWALKTDARPVFSYAGSTEMKSTREIRSFIRYGKSVNVVSIDNGSVSVERIPLKSVRFQYLVATSPGSYITDIEEAISKYSGRFGNKKPIFTVRISGTADRDKVISDLKKYDGIIFRPPEIIPDHVDVETRPGMENMSDYIGAYFRDHPELSELVTEYYRNARGDREAAIKALLERLGVSE